MLLPGSELAGYIKAQQAQAVRSLQHTGQGPKLTIISDKEEVVSDKYIELKQRYGADIGVDVEHMLVRPDTLEDTILQLNKDEAVHGIIVQLPLAEEKQVDSIVSQITPEKDVDGLGRDATYDPATPTAILWLLSGHDIDLTDKQIGIVGQGRLVGAPLRRMLEASGYELLVCDEDTGDLQDLMRASDIVITATGQPGLISGDLVRDDQVIIDVGTADVGGSLKGDVDESVYERDRVKVSPVPGGVGPLTVCALFGNVIRAFKMRAG